jgi:Flp pilus assembly protein TadG
MFLARAQRWSWLKGQALIMTALITPVLMSGALISTDTAILVAGRAQMQSMTDGAALAGAQQLADDNRLTGTTNIATEMAAAQTQATSIAQSNRVLSATPVITSNPQNASTGQIVTGYLSPTDFTSTSVSTSASKATYNAVQVTGIRDSSHGGVIPTFFGGPLGINGSTMRVTSIATAQNYTIQGFQSVNGMSANLLPIVLDLTTYNNMIAGSTQDSYFWSPAPTSAVSAGPDGVHESIAYPVGSGNPGNWGTIKVGVSNNSTSTLSAQITGGITPAELATFPNGVIQLDTTQSPPSITFSGNPGISAGIQSALTSIIGKPVTMPIYDQTGGNGNNAWYRVVEFACVRIMAVNFQGNPKYVVVQPALVNDPTAIAGDPQPSWTNGGLVKLFLSR